MVKILTCILVFIMIQNIAKSEDFNNIPQEYYLYVGAYTKGEDEGINIYKFDASDGDLEYITTEKGIVNPSYLAIHPKNKLLIAVNEIGEYKGEKSGAVSSFAINSDGSLRQLSRGRPALSRPSVRSHRPATDVHICLSRVGGSVVNGLRHAQCCQPSAASSGSWSRRGPALLRTMSTVG